MNCVLLHDVLPAQDLVQKVLSSFHAVPATLWKMFVGNAYRTKSMLLRFLSRNFFSTFCGVFPFYLFAFDKKQSQVFSSPFQSIWAFSYVRLSQPRASKVSFDYSNCFAEVFPHNRLHISPNISPAPAPDLVPAFREAQNLCRCTHRARTFFSS